jgi:pimeloyl-ACP methyl ester carboxylesterase
MAPSLSALFAAAFIASSASRLSVVAGIPATPHYFANNVDHFSADPATYLQRYYLNDTNFGGPGHPIICIMGGEGAIEPTTGLFYPYVASILAGRLGALVVEPEHRFFGSSLPTSPYDTSSLSLLTAQQALADAAVFIEGQRTAYGCTGRNGQPRCPVITVGGSYPGWLSAMMRLRFPAVVDMAWAASAPMRFYSQATAQYEYYRIVTESAEKAVPGCPAAMRGALARTLAIATKDEMISGLNLCTPLPAYIDAGDALLLQQEVSMVIM